MTLVHWLAHWRCCPTRRSRLDPASQMLPGDHVGCSSDGRPQWPRTAGSPHGEVQECRSAGLTDHCGHQKLCSETPDLTPDRNKTGRVGDDLMILKHGNHLSHWGRCPITGEQERDQTELDVALLRGTTVSVIVRVRTDTLT